MNERERGALTAHLLMGGWTSMKGMSDKQNKGYYLTYTRPTFTNTHTHTRHAEREFTVKVWVGRNNDLDSYYIYLNDATHSRSKNIHKFDRALQRIEKARAHAERLARGEGLVHPEEGATWPI